MPDLFGNLFGDIARPALSGVKGNDPNWIVVLAFEQVGDHRFHLGVLDVGLPPGLTAMSKVVEHQVDGLVLSTRDDRRGPFRLTHDATPLSKIKANATLPFRPELYFHEDRCS